MTTIHSQNQPPDKANKTLLSRVMDSAILKALVRFPPVAWVVRKSASLIIRRRIHGAKPETRAIRSDVPTNFQADLDAIVRDIVDAFGYAGAMIATYEQGDELPVRAVYVDPQVATLEQIHQWEQEVNKRLPADKAVSLTDPAIARVYVNDPQYERNLSIRAVKAGRSVVSDSLFDLFTPVLPDITKAFMRGLQDGLGIQQVIAMPFFLAADTDGQTERELIGNLFVIKRAAFTEKDEVLLGAFTRQAAAAILSERRRSQAEMIERLILDIQRRLRSEDLILERIVHGVVNDLGYAGAMVARYEPDDSLPVRAFFVNPRLASMEQIRQWEQQVNTLLPPDRQFSFSDAKSAPRVYVHNAAYQNNLSVKASRAGQPVTSSRFFDLFTPIAPDVSEPILAGVQEELKIRQVIAVPFFLETDASNEKTTTRLVGNLFAATQSGRFAYWEIELLQAFGQQAALGLANARLYQQTLEQKEQIVRLYKQSEDRQKAAQILGRMAFSATANIHTFRNHIGVIRGNLQLLTKLDSLAQDEAIRRSLLNQLAPPIMQRLNKVSEILDSLHTPWQLVTDEEVDVNRCLENALNKIVQDREGWVTLSLAENLPSTYTSKDMLTEAFRILIKNAVEAITERVAAAKDGSPEQDCPRALTIASRWQPQQQTIEVEVRDNGIGIRPENMAHVFEMRWTTKQTGLGFGLFFVRDYIEGLGGTVQASSVWQQGSTFTLCLPVRAAASDQAGEAPTISEVGASRE